jgi:vitellogenic carboxypeptidase-like protein
MSDSVSDLDAFNYSYTFPCMYSGFVKTDELQDTNMYYMFFRDEALSITAPLIIWLNGGPGSSSQIGTFLENGPLRLVKNAEDNVEVHSLTGVSWTSFGNIIFLDQPANTGYSYGNKLFTSEAEIRANALKFVQNFYLKHPEMADRDLYITGESYAGIFIPNIAHEILLFNQKATDAEKIPLKGVAVGNGFMQPLEQRLSAHKLSIAAGLLQFESLPQLEQLHLRCEEASVHNKSISYDVCYKIMKYMEDMDGNQDMLDIRYTKTNATDQVERAEEYLNRPLVVTQLYADISPRDPKFTGLNKETFDTFNRQEGNTPYSHLYDALLDFNLPVLVYYGNMDTKIGGYQQLDLLNNMNWTYMSEFYASSHYAYHYVSDDNGEVRLGGNFKKYKSFNFLTVYSAGHLVPTTQLAMSRSFMIDFIQSKDLQCHQVGSDCLLDSISCKHMNNCNGNGQCINGQ